MAGSAITVQRLLVERGDKSAVKPLEKLVATSPNAKTRLQALCTLDGLRAITPEILEKALNDAHPSGHARTQSASKRTVARQIHGGEQRALRAAWLKAQAGEANARVRYQLAFSLGEWHSAEAGRMLAKFMIHYPKDERLRIAVMSSATNHVSEMRFRPRCNMIPRDGRLFATTGRAGSGAG